MNKSQKVEIRTPEQIEIMQQSGAMTANALKEVLLNAQPGVSLIELEKIATDTIHGLGGESSFKTVPGYFWTTCLTINDEVVHGIPRDIKLQLGDVLGIDLGAVYQGWHTDAAWSKLIDDIDPKKKRFLEIGEMALEEAIAKAIDGNQIGDISSAIQTRIEGAGYSIIKNLCGHGVGKKLHEAPEIPGFGKPKTGMVLKAGMTIAIEVIYNMGKGDIFEKADGWTISSSDGSLGGLFEMSVVVGEDKPQILTDWRRFGKKGQPIDQKHLTS